MNQRTSSQMSIQPPLSANDLFEQFDALGIVHHTIGHPPLFTVEQSKQLRGDLPGAHSKNLFLRNKKGKMWLLTCLESRQLSLKTFGHRIGSGALSFCSPERLLRYLGVIPGAVTPFAVINDHASEVEVLLDRALLDIDPLNFHPLDNTKTTSIAPGDLLKFLEATNHTPRLVDFEEQTAGSG